MANKLINKVLMCTPDYFSVDYVINPWMKVGSVDLSKAKRQWSSLVKTLEKLDIKVQKINQEKGLPDMVFAADQCLIKGNKLVVSNFHYPQRRGETEYYLRWFGNKNYQMSCIPKKYFFEGNGECVWAGNTLLVGTGFRNSDNVCEVLTNFLNVDVICLTLVDPKFYHLDTCLFALNENVAFYYPKAFSPKSRKILKNKFKELVPLSKHDAEGFAANSMVTDHHVVVQKGNKEFEKQLSGYGYKVVEEDVSEFLKSGGGIHCLVQVLEEEYE